MAPRGRLAFACVFLTACSTTALTTPSAATGPTRDDQPAPVLDLDAIAEGVEQIANDEYDEPSLLAHVDLETSAFIVAFVAMLAEDDTSDERLASRLPEGAPPPPPAGMNPAGPPSHHVGFASGSALLLSYLDEAHHADRLEWSIRASLPPREDGFQAADARCREGPSYLGEPPEWLLPADRADHLRGVPSETRDALRPLFDRTSRITWLGRLTCGSDEYVDVGTSQRGVVLVIRELWRYIEAYRGLRSLGG